jgi:sugar/nucleoside kinase (ribokinase family)
VKLLIVGSVAYDTVKTPFGERTRVLGGSASYSSLAASFFTKAALMGAVGEDFDPRDRALFADRGIDTTALTTVPGGKTFHWSGEYGYDLNEAKTLRTDLNVLGTFDPQVPDALRQTPYLFLANLDPTSQAKVLDQVTGARVVAADTMNYWIDNRRDDLLKLLPRVHILLVNEGEARQLSGEYNLVQGGRKILGWGPKMLIIKRGEYGVLMISGDSLFATPAYPLESVFDPTGAGDTFAGGFLGSLAKSGDITQGSVRRAIVMGNVMASFNVEAFSLDRMRSLTESDIHQRFQVFKRLTDFSGMV